MANRGQGGVQYTVPFFQVPDALVEDDRTNCYHLAAFNVLAMHGNKDGRCWPSVARIAKLMNCTPNTARKAVNELAELGWLILVRRYDEKTGEQMSNLYILQHSLDRAAPDEVPPPQETTGGVPQETTRGVPHQMEPNYTNKEPYNIEPYKTSAVAVAPDKPNRLKDEVANMFEDFFWEVNGQPASFGRERKSCNRLAVVCRARFPDHPMDFATAIVEEYNAAIEAHEKFWDEQPRSASGLLAHFDRVVSRLRDRDRRSATIEERLAAVEGL